MHHAFNMENFKPHHTLPFYKIHASHVNFGLHHAFLVNPLPICYTVVISEWTMIHAYHATKLMGIMTNVWVMHYLIIFKKLCGWGEEMLENSFGKNNSMGSLKGISSFALKISKSTLFTVCHTNVMKISLRICCSINKINILLSEDFLSSDIHCCLTVNWYCYKILENWSLLRVQILSSIQSSNHLIIIP